MKDFLTHLLRFESDAVEVIWEVVSEAEKPVIMCSTGKDSTMTLHAAKRTFYPSYPPFPLKHADTLLSAETGRFSTPRHALVRLKTSIVSTTDIGP